MKLYHVALALLVDVAWAGNFFFGKIGVDHFSPMLFTSLRFAVLALILLPFIRPLGKQWRSVLAVCVTTGTLHFALMFTGLAIASNVSAVAIVVQLGVPMTTILAAVFLHEKVGWRRSVGIAVSFLGVMVLGFDPAVFEEPLAVLLIILGALSISIGMIQLRKIRGVSVFTMQGWVGITSAPGLLILSLLLEEGQVQALMSADWLQWTAVAYSAIAASLIGHGITYYLLQRYPVSTISPFHLLVPVLAVAFGLLVWGDPLTTPLAIGGGLTIGGVAFITLREAGLWRMRRKAEKASRR